MRLSSDSFGRRLAAIRKSRLTQGELGALVGRSKSAIRAWECGLYGVKVGDIMKYAHALSCRLNDLLASVGAQLPRATSNFGARMRRRGIASVQDACESAQLAGGGASSRGRPS